jgi:hypothetical protein
MRLCDRLWRTCSIISTQLLKQSGCITAHADPVSCAPSTHFNCSGEKLFVVVALLGHGIQTNKAQSLDNTDFFRWLGIQRYANNWLFSDPADNACLNSARLDHRASNCRTSHSICVSVYVCLCVCRITPVCPHVEGLLT